MKKKEHRALFSRFKPGLGKWLCFLCALLFPFFVFASNKGLVGYWPLSERSEALGSELMNSPSAETGITKLNNYYSSIRSTDERSTEQSHSGSYSMKIITETNDGNGTYFQMGNYGNMNGLEIGKTYEFSVWVYIPSGQGITLSNVYMAGAGACTTNTATENDIWQRLSCSKTITTGATEVYTRYFIGGYPTAGIYAYWDDFSIKEITTADATPNNNNGSVLNGPAYTAGRDGKGLGEELVTNGEFDTNTTGWTAYNSSSLSVDTQQLKVTNTDALYGTAYQVISVVPGKKYRYSVTNKGGTNTQRIMFVGPAVYNNTLGQVTVAENGRGYIDFTAATSTIYIHVRNDNVSGNYGLWDDFSVREISSGQAMSFDGVDDYVDMGDVVSNENQLTVSAWINPSSTSGTDYFIGEGASFRIAINDAGNVVCWHRGDNISGQDTNDYSTTTTTPISAMNHWYNIVCVWNGTAGTRKIYVNQNLELSDTTAVTVFNGDSNNFSIGDGYSGEGAYFSGSISDVRIYDRALSAAEIEQLYSGSGESTASTGSLNKGLVGHWPLNTESKKSATVVADTTPHSNNGTLSGAVVRNNGYSFDGIDDDGILLKEDILLRDNYDWSVSAWIKTSNTGLNTVLSNASGGPVAQDIGLHNSKMYYAHYDNAWIYESGSTIVADGNWHFLTWINHTNETIDMYIDGSLEASALNSALSSATGPVNQIGRNWYHTFAGSISNVRIYDRALSVTEVSNLYNGSDIPGAIGHWPLSSGPGDVSGNGNNGTVSGATLIGEAASFDGGVTSGDMINLEHPFEIDLTSFALGFWVKRNSLTTADGTNTTQALRILYGGGSYKFLDYWISNGKFKFHGERDVNSEYWGNLTTNIVADTNWHYVTITGDDNVFDIYMDGVYQGTDDDSAAGYTSNTCTILAIGKGYGAAHGSYGSYFAGEIKDLKYYDRPLSATEVATLYDQGHGKPKQATIGNLNKGLVGYWPLKSKYETTSAEIHTDFDMEQNVMTSPWSWDPKTDGVRAEYTADTYKGSKSAKLTNSTVGPIAFWQSQSSVPIGTYFRVGVWAKNIDCPTIPYFNAAGATYVSGDISFTDISTSEWKFYSALYKSTASTVNIYVRTGENASQGSFLIDNFGLKKNTTADITPYANHGYVYGATVASGYTAFDGVDNEVAVSDISFSQNEDWSFSMWQYKPTGSASSWQGFIGAQLGSSGGVNGGYWMWHPQLMWYQDYYDDGGGAHSWGYLSSSVNLGDEVPYDEWFHLTVTYNASNYEVKAYINGILEETKTISWSSRPVTNFTVRTIGEGDSSRYFEGSIADTRVYNRVLSDREVKMLYDKGR